jgi:hypothetical protein
MAATLRSALRGTPPTCPLPPLPCPSESHTTTPTALRSRFSAETLMIKPSPSKKTLKNFFSASSPTDGSAPALLSSTMTTTRRYHRRLSATQAARAAREEEEHVRDSARFGHFPSASESRLDLNTTTSPSNSTPDYHQPPSPPPPEQARRGSFAGIGRSRSRSRSRPSLRGRRASSSNGNGTGTGIGALEAAADKLAGVAREALGKFTTSGRHRAPRQQSNSETSSARHSFASSSSFASAPPPPPTTRVGPHPEESYQHVRELSAGSAATGSSTTSPSGVHRRGRPRPLPELAATRPRPKHLPANPRPAAPPSPTIPPLNYTSHTTTNNNTNFRAHAVHLPSSEILRSHEYLDLFVRLDVGGQSSYMTTVATLLEAEDGGGKLGEFVAALLFLEEGSMASGSSLAPIDDDEPEQSPSRHATSSQPAPPPLPHSPFPFAADEISLFEPGSPFADPAASPPSSIEPLVHTAATTLLGEHFAFSLPALAAASSPTTPTLKEVSPSQNAQRVLLVPSPTLPSGTKHASVYPDYGTLRAAVVAVKAERDTVLPAMVFDELDLPPLHLASSSSCSSSSSSATSGNSESSSSSSSSSSEPESFIDFGSPGDTPKRSHFEVMREQLFHRQADDAQDRSSLASEGAVHVRHSLTYGEVQRPVSTLFVWRVLYRRPVDRSLHTQEDQVFPVEARTKPAFECAASSKEHNHASSCREMVSAQLDPDAIKADTPRLKAKGARLQQRQSSSTRVSTPSAERTIDIFLDRTDFPISSPYHPAESGAVEVATVYSALLAFLRGGAFPAVLSIPEFEATTPAPASSDSGTRTFLRPGSAAAMSYLSTFKTIKDEARWLGLHAAERACDRYIKHLSRLASAGSGGGSSINRDMRKMQTEKAQGREGWI